MLVKIEARILIFPGTDFYFPSTSVPPGTFLGSVKMASRIYLLTVVLLGCVASRPVTGRRLPLATSHR